MVTADIFTNDGSEQWKRGHLFLVDSIDTYCDRVDVRVIPFGDPGVWTIPPKTWDNFAILPNNTGLAVQDKVWVISGKHMGKTGNLEKYLNESLKWGVKLETETGERIACLAESLFKLKAPPAKKNGSASESKYPDPTEHVSPRTDDSDMEPPDELMCPISLELMTDPVSTVDGHVYERSEILEWFAQGYYTSPKTRKDLPRNGPNGQPKLTPAYALKSLCAAWRKKEEIDKVPPPKPPSQPE